MTAADAIRDVLLAAGVGVIALACIGVAVGATAFDRLHFSSPVALGALLIAGAVLAENSFSLIADKALLLAAFVFVTSPVLVHATGRVLRARELGDWRLARDERLEIERR